MIDFSLWLDCHASWEGKAKAKKVCLEFPAPPFNCELNLTEKVRCNPISFPHNAPYKMQNQFVIRAFSRVRIIFPLFYSKWKLESLTLCASFCHHFSKPWPDFMDWKGPLFCWLSKTWIIPCQAQILTFYGHTFVIRFKSWGTFKLTKKSWVEIFPICKNERFSLTVD